MSDIKKRLRALKGKAPEIKNEKSNGSSARAKIIDDLKSLISKVENQPSKTDIQSEELKPKRGLLSSELIEGPGQNIEDLIPGEFCSTPHGKCFFVRTVYPWHYYQGNIPVNALLDQDPQCLEWAVSDKRFKDIDFTQALFFDTETTGLDTGAGTYIFLAGFGYYEHRNFIVEQYFMRDFPEEPAVIHAIDELLKRFRYIVSYNGKTYDWPLLETRFIVNHRSLPNHDPPHLDLLTLARRIYRFRLENCRLTSVEENILGFHRKDDLPGALLPDLYFKYIRSRDARHIHQAFAHNAHDIISLAAISSRMIQFLHDPFLKDTYYAEDIYAYARMKEAASDFNNAENAYTKALKQGLPRHRYQDALRRLSLIYKRNLQWSKAVNLWEVEIQTGDRDKLFPYSELAKYYEHQVKDYKKAVTVVQRAVSELKTSGWEFDKIQKELLHRRNRLEAKLKGEKWY